MKANWNAETYDAPRRRLVPCYREFYGTVGELVARTGVKRPRMLDLGAGTGLLSAEVVRHVEPGSLTLQDASAEMLDVARTRLSKWSPRFEVGDITDRLAEGTFDVIMSALAIHHLSDADKRTLLARVFDQLAPGGLFINAEQVRHEDVQGQRLFETMHLDHARRLGSTDDEIQAAIKRMDIDRCATTEVQVAWLKQAGFERAAIYYQWFRFAVFAGWKADATERQDEMSSSSVMPSRHQ